MPRKAKTQTDQSVSSSNGTPPQLGAPRPEEPQKPAKKSSSGKSASKKAPAARTKSKSAQPAQKRRHPTEEEIRMRAYFIAERRVQMGIPGSEHDDWLEARRQLEAELGK